MNAISVHNKTFVPYLDQYALAKKVSVVAQQISRDYTDKMPLFLVVLNGAFMFASDLLKQINIACELSFVKLSSYSGMESSGNIRQLIGINEEVSGRAVIIIEDIVDTGNTLQQLLLQINALQPASVEVCSLLYKPAAMLYDIPLKYVVLEVPNKFFLGYGLDFDGQGRNLPTLYQLAD